MSASKTQLKGEESRRATHQSLPKLIIPAEYDCHAEPKSVPDSCRTRFLFFCDKYGFAPSIRNIDANIDWMARQEEDTSSDEESEHVDENLCKTLSSSAKRRQLWERAENMVVGQQLETLDLDGHDLLRWRRTHKMLQTAKEQHTQWIDRLNDNPRDPEAVQKCRQWRLARERLSAIIDLIPEKIIKRQQLCKELNQRWHET